MRIRLTAMICLFFVSVTALQAQVFDKGTINGSLVDEQGKAVPFATVLLRKAGDSAVAKTALSNEQGVFTFHYLKAGNYFTEVKMLRFEKLFSKNVEISEGSPAAETGILQLKSATVNLGGVTVKGEPPFIERQLDKTVVNVENSIVSVGASVLEVMEKLPGVQVKQDGQISLNGKAGVTVYMDGKATQLSSEDLANLLRGMSSASVQKIELMAKPSARYDAAGTAGIINIVRKKNRKEGVNGTVNLGFAQGRYPKYNGGFDLSYKTKKINLFLGYTYLGNNNFRTANTTRDFYDKEVLNTSFISENYHIRKYKTHSPVLGAVFFLSPKTTLSVSGTGSFQFYKGNSDSWSQQYDARNVKQKYYGFTNKTDDELFNYAANMHLSHQLDTSGTELTVDLDYSNYRKDSYQDINNTLKEANGQFISNVNNILDQDGDLNIYSGKADFVKPLKNNLRLEAGIKASYVKSKNDMEFFLKTGEVLKLDSGWTNYFKYTENINAAYLNLNKQYKKLTVQLGLRVEQTIGRGEQVLTKEKVNQDYFQFFPSLFIDYKISEQHALNFQGGRRIDRPAYLDLNPLRRISNSISFMQGNPFLRPQLSYNGAVTYSWRNELHFTLGYTSYTDYMTAAAFPDGNEGISGTKLINISGGEAVNLDIAWSKKLLPWWTTNNSVSFFYQSFHGTVNDQKINMEGTPSFYVNTNNSFSLTKKLSAELTFWYMHRNQEGPSVYKPNTSLSFGFKYPVLNRRGSLTLNVNDILRTEAFRFSTNSGSIREIWELRNDTRLVKLNFTYRFGNTNAKKMRLKTGAEDEKKRAAK